MKTAICNELFEGWPIEEVFDYAAELGYDGVELAPFTLGETVADISPAQRNTIVKAAEKAGVEIAGMHWLLVQPEGLYINHPDPGICRTTRDYLRELIGLCADLGGKVLVHGSPKQRNIQEGWDPDETWKRARETFEVCARAAEEHGVCYCLEALTTAETNFIITLDQALQMVNEIDSPHFQYMLDCRSISASAGVRHLPRTLGNALQTGKLRHIHANDPNGRGPGFGELAFAPLLKELTDADYDGFISVEVFNYNPDPRTIAARSLGYLLGILEALGYRADPITE